MSPPPMTREYYSQQYVFYYYVNSAGRINGYYFYRRTWFIWLVPNESPNVTELSSDYRFSYKKIRLQSHLKIYIAEE